MAAAVPATLLIYVNDSKAWFYGIGIAEAIFIIASLVSVFISRKSKKADAGNKA